MCVFVILYGLQSMTYGLVEQGFISNNFSSEETQWSSEKFPVIDCYSNWRTWDSEPVIIGCLHLIYISILLMGLTHTRLKRLESEKYIGLNWLSLKIMLCSIFLDIAVTLLLDPGSLNLECLLNLKCLSLTIHAKSKQITNK